MDNNRNNVLEDPRERNPKYSNEGVYSKLLRFEARIYRMLDVQNERSLSIQSSFLTEIADKDLYLEPAPHIFCLYDFVDEFLEEGGIEVSYASNNIQFKPINLKKAESIKNFQLKKEELKKATIGLVIIGWGTAIIGIARENEIEELSKFRASQLGRYDWTRFSSKEELDWWIKREKKEAYRNICRIVSSEFQPKIKELDYILIGLKKLVKESSIDLDWFSNEVKEKISNVIELDQDTEPKLKDLLLKDNNQRNRN